MAYGQQIEFQGPLVQNVAYTTGSHTVNITYTAVSNIELRNPNGFEVWLYVCLTIKVTVLVFLGLLSRKSMLE